MNRAWIDLDREDLNQLLISMIGFRFGERPAERLDEIRAERKAYAQKFIRLASVGNNDTVLDVGSGCGFGTAAIAERARRVIACDISPAFLSFARAECDGIDTVEFHEVQPRDFTFLGDASLDAVISMSVFIHLNLYDMHACFLEFQRLLRPGGRVVFDFADAHRLFTQLRSHGNNELFREHSGYYRENAGNLPGLLQFNSARGIRNVASDAGFRLARRRGHLLKFVRR